MRHVDFGGGRHLVAVGVVAGVIVDDGLGADGRAHGAVGLAGVGRVGRVEQPAGDEADDEHEGADGGDALGHGTLLFKETRNNHKAAHSVLPGSFLLSHKTGCTAAKAPS